MKKTSRLTTKIIGWALFALSFVFYTLNVKELGDFGWEDIKIPTIMGGVGILLLINPQKVVELSNQLRIPIPWSKGDSSKSDQNNNA